MSTPAQGTPAPVPAPAPSPAAPSVASSTSAAKPQRVLACVLCQHRKVKCDRKFPCANCVRSHVQCVPASTLPARPRRRRFPERDLLERVRRYESLLRDNDIKFDPLHKDSPPAGKQSRDARVGDRDDSSDDERPRAATGTGRSPSPSATVKSESVYKVKSFWNAMNQKPLDSDDDSSDVSSEGMRKTVFQEAWAHFRCNDEPFLFGSHRITVDVVALHPEQVQIFRLWQVYLENVNPLLKMTHTPTLQARIIDAASNVASIQPTLAALMFGIYCTAIVSLTDDECRAMFGSSHDELLARYQLGGQQALLNCGFLRTTDRECLTAFYLYLVSVRPDTDPRSLSSMLSIAIRLAQRMGLHSESANAKCSPLEAEMRRRLWWALVIYDTRICEMSSCTASTLVPTWDCKVPLNVNDFDLHPEMKNPPAAYERSTEALFAVVRSEIGENTRHAAYHLDFTIPALKLVAKDVQGGPGEGDSELDSLQQMIEEKYLRFCDPENPLHFMTVWTARSQLARNRLFETYSRRPTLPAQQSEAQRDAALFHAITMLEIDTRLTTSPLTHGFQWLLACYFPFLAYMHAGQDLRRRPTSVHAARAWAALAANKDARRVYLGDADNPFVRILTRLVLMAWEAREALAGSAEDPPTPPPFVFEILQNLAPPVSGAPAGVAASDGNVLGMTAEDFAMGMPMGFGGQGMYDMGGQAFDGAGQGQLDLSMGNLDLSTMDWNPVVGRGW